MRNIGHVDQLTLVMSGVLHGFAAGVLGAFGSCHYLLIHFGSFGTVTPEGQLVDQIIFVSLRYTCLQVQRIKFVNTQTHFRCKEPCLILKMVALLPLLFSGTYVSLS